MAGHEDHRVANADRTVLDHGAEDPEREAAEHLHTERTERSDPHDQPWSKVAGEIKEAVENADGPFE